ncbi:unnamed protein product, partial [Ectocarpus sp. 8 AP-2014]
MTTQELVFLDPKTIKDSQVDEVTQVVSKAFQDFNTSVNAPVEVYEEEFGHPEIGPTVILTQIAANSRSFSLYAKLGFETKHTVQYIGGFLEPPSEGSLPLPPAPSGVTLKAMVAADVEECAELFLEAHGKDCGWDRRADITGCLGSGFPFPMLVARDANGKVVGYSTG